MSEPSFYKAKVAELAATKKLAWLKPFEKTIDDVLSEVAQQTSREAVRFDPLMVEMLSSQLVSTLNECLAWRREIYDLEAKAFQQALDYAYFDRLQAADMQVAVLSPSDAAIKALQAAHAAAHEEFGSRSDLAEAWAALHSGLAEAAGKDLESRIGRLTAIANRAALVAEAQSQLQLQHEERGNALNYGERCVRLTNYLRRDWRLAILLARALAAGTRQLFKTKQRLPSVADAGALDSLCAWTSRTLEEVGYAKQREVEFERVVPLHTAYARSHGNDRRLAGKAAFKVVHDDDEPGKLRVNVSPALPQLLGRLRLLAVGLAYSVSDKNNSYGRSISAVIFPPPQKDLLAGSRQTIRRGPIILPTVGQAPDYYDGSAIKNIDPRGVWEIFIEHFHVVDDGDDHTHRWDQVRDLKLHFVLGGIPAQDPDQWPE